MSPALLVCTCSRLASRSRSWRGLEDVTLCSKRHEVCVDRLRPFALPPAAEGFCPYPATAVGQKTPYPR